MSHKFWYDGQFGFFNSGSYSGSGFTGSFTGSFTGDGSTLSGLSPNWSDVNSKPSGLISGSSISGSFTGSFSGSFIGAAPDLTVVLKSSAYSLTNSDIDKQFRVSGTTTITLPNGLTWSTNKGCEIVNTGGGTVTVATSSPVTINGDASDVSLTSYQGIVLMNLVGDDYLGTGNQTSGGGVV